MKRKHTVNSTVLGKGYLSRVDSEGTAEEVTSE